MGYAARATLLRPRTGLCFEMRASGWAIGAVVYECRLPGALRLISFDRVDGVATARVRWAWREG